MSSDRENTSSSSSSSDDEIEIKTFAACNVTRKKRVATVTLFFNAKEDGKEKSRGEIAKLGAV
jgi:hypothetical protein